MPLKRMQVFNLIRKKSPISANGEMNCVFLRGGVMPPKKLLFRNLSCGIISRSREKEGYIIELDNNNHSVFLLYYHLVLVAKYRRKVFSNKMSQYAKDIFVRIGSSYNITLEEWNHEQDHVHILFRAHPNTEISKFINAYKSASSRLIKKDFPEVRPKLWKEMFWPRSFCLLTTGGAPIETIRNHIKKAGQVILVNKAYRYRLYPTTEQKSIFAKTFGCARFIYNKMLGDRLDYYMKTGKKLNNTPAQYKDEFPWLREVDSLALANAQLNLNKAYNNFWNNRKHFGKQTLRKTSLQV